MRVDKSENGSMGGLVPLNLTNLDEKTRVFMRQEVETDIENNNLYLSRWFTAEGKQLYPGLLRETASTGNDTTLRDKLSGPGIFVESYEKKKPSGGTTMAAVPNTAPETFAEGEFNRFYIRGPCLRCQKEGIREVEIYRAKQVANPRPESEARIGKRVDCATLLVDLRANPGVDTALGVPAGPNSGLSVRIS